MLPYIDGMYSVYYTAGRIVRKISRPAAGRIDTAYYMLKRLKTLGKAIMHEIFLMLQKFIQLQ